jgi:hypothetical protein
MTSEQLAGILRTILAAGAGFAISKGYVDEATATAVIGGAVTIAVAVWSFLAKKRPAQ